MTSPDVAQGPVPCDRPQADNGRAHNQLTYMHIRYHARIDTLDSPPRMPMSRRRKQRLPLDAYDVPGSTWHITTTVLRSNGSPFLSTEFGLDALDAFITSCHKAGAIVHLVCIMPDHLHALIEVRADNLTKVVGRAKSITTRQWWERGGVGALWQESFHDHGIRESRDFEETVVYLLNNPVAAGLVEEWEMYPLIGGLVIVEQ